VTPDDTLWDIAMGYGISVNTLMAANPGVNPQRLQNGQVLVIPGAEGAAPIAASAPSTPYTIRQNDTLWTIAAGFGISVDTLTAANPGVDPKLLRTGQVLTVPGVHQVAAPAAVEAAVGAAAAPAAPTDAVVTADAVPAEQPPTEQPPAEQPPPPDAPPPPAPAGMPGEFVDAANQLLARMNEKRAANGIHPLTWNAELAAAAQAHANDCAARNKGSHVGSDGARLPERLARAGYPAATLSENWANSRSVGSAFDMWWNEPPGADPHRRNILWSRYTEIGLGIAKGGWGYHEDPRSHDPAGHRDAALAHLRAAASQVLQAAGAQRRQRPGSSPTRTTWARTSTARSTSSPQARTSPAWTWTSSSRPRRSWTCRMSAATTTSTLPR
jgi:uncharacterized protein YkwD